MASSVDARIRPINMKRLSFFKVYGRVDPRLDEIRGWCTVRSRGGILSMLHDCPPLEPMLPQAAIYPYLQSMFGVVRDSYGRHEQSMRIAMSTALEMEENINRPAPRAALESATVAANEFGRLVGAEAVAAIRRMALREPVFRHPYFDESETVEAIREREKQNFLCNQRNAKMMAQPTTQRKIDRMFGRHDPSGRKESLAHHARAIRLKLEAKGMDTKQVEKFILSMRLDEKSAER